MSRFTRWRERQKAKQFREEFQCLGEVKEFEMRAESGEIIRKGVAECGGGVRMYIAPLASQRIITKALGGIVKPKQ